MRCSPLTPSSHSPPSSCTRRASARAALCRASSRVPCARRVYQAQNGQRNLAEQLKDGLTPYQIGLLEKVRAGQSPTRSSP